MITSINGNTIINNYSTNYKQKMINIDNKDSDNKYINY